MWTLSDFVVPVEDSIFHPFNEGWSKGNGQANRVDRKARQKMTDGLESYEQKVEQVEHGWDSGIGVRSV